VDLSDHSVLALMDWRERVPLQAAVYYDKNKRNQKKSRIGRPIRLDKQGLRHIKRFTQGMNDWRYLTWDSFY
jgi:hypothetical protein